MLQQLSPIEFAQMVGSLAGNEDVTIDQLVRYYGVSPQEANHLMETAAFAQNVGHGGSAYTRTTLGSQESDFQRWLAANFRHPEFEGQDLTPAYDMRRFWKDMMTGVPGAVQHLSLMGTRANPRLGVTYPPQYETPYSFGFGPQSVFYRK